jgi:hypothetical protein
MVGPSGRSLQKNVVFCTPPSSRLLTLAVSNHFDANQVIPKLYEGGLKFGSEHHRKLKGLEWLNGSSNAQAHGRWSHVHRGPAEGWFGIHSVSHADLTKASGFTHNTYAVVATASTEFDPD